MDELSSRKAMATALPIMRKFVLARKHDEKLMRCLHQRRVTAGRLFPGIAGAALTERTLKRGIQAKRKLAAWDDAYLVKLLHGGLPKNQAD